MRRWLNLTRGFRRFTSGSGTPRLRRSAFLRASLLQLLHSIRSERRLVERLEFDMLFRWFVGLMIDEKAFDAFSKNRDRLLTHAIAQAFLSSLLGLPEVKGLLSAEHFSVDGTMLKAWASMKSFRPKSASGEGPGNGPGEPPGLSWPPLDGEPQRAGGGRRGDAGDRNGRARGGGAHEPALAQGGDAGRPARATTPRPSSRG